MPNQPIKLPEVEYAMLVELSKKDRKTPIQYLSALLTQQYNGKR
jgi:hypothetical protein